MKSIKNDKKKYLNLTLSLVYLDGNRYNYKISKKKPNLQSVLEYIYYN